MEKVIMNMMQNLPAAFTILVYVSTAYQYYIKKYLTNLWRI